MSCPTNIDYKIEAAIASYRLLATDLAHFFAKLPREAISSEDFAKESTVLVQQIETWKERLDPVFHNEDYRVQSFGARKRDPNDIVDPYIPGGLHKGPLFTFNFLASDWHAVHIMFKYKKALTLKEPPPAELVGLALELCRLFETIEYWPESPSGSILKVQSNLAIASLFLPKDERHILWCRRKFAMIESLGWVLVPAQVSSLRNDQS